nr:hypothetical protein [Pseudonocardia petroleophila]
MATSTTTGRPAVSVPVLRDPTVAGHRAGHRHEPVAVVEPGGLLVDDRDLQGGVGSDRVDDTARHGVGPGELRIADHHRSSVSAEVTDVLDPTSFELAGQEYGEDSLLVQTAAPTDVVQGQVVRVVGTVGQYLRFAEEEGVPPVQYDMYEEYETEAYVYGVLRGQHPVSLRRPSAAHRRVAVHRRLGGHADRQRRERPDRVRAP